jgi:hypothetical protein
METFVPNCKTVAQIILIHSKISDILINEYISKSFSGLVDYENKESGRWVQMLRCNIRPTFSEQNYNSYLSYL